jgi:2-polyprenyl-6-methoxyphenol hydroxylase-like FAD-dependent oxidoreductase
MTSIALRRLGHTVTIFERSTSPLLHDQGAGIVAGGETQQFMQLFDKWNRDVAVTSKQRLYLNRAGEIMDMEDRPQRMASWDLLYYVCRANFDDLESGYVDHESVVNVEGEGKTKYCHGRAVTDVSLDPDQDNKVKVTYHDRLSTETTGLRTTYADLVIIADGPSSSLRHKLVPNAPFRTYTGYVAFRGTVPEPDLSETAKQVFVERFPFFHGPGTQILAYTIPGRAGDLTPGSRLVNWVWYINVPGDSQEFKDIMTDRSGASHRWTLPAGGHMASSVWAAQLHRARATLPPQFCELIEKTELPFVQAISDLAPAEPTPWLLDGKAVLVGDALCGFRPHTAASTSQAAMHAIMLYRLFKGEMGEKGYESEAMRFARMVQRQGVALGERSQFGRHPLNG